MPSIVIQEWNSQKVYPESTVISYQGTYYVSTDTNAASTPSDLEHWVHFVTATGQFLPELTPVNGVAASGTLTFSDVVSDGETVTIGSDVYEFDDDAMVTSGNILVDISGGDTAAEAATAMQNAVNENGTDYSGTADTADFTVTYNFAGEEGNAIATTTTCQDGAWEEETLTGGVTATEGAKGTLVADDEYLYVAIAENVWARIELETGF